MNSIVRLNEQDLNRIVGECVRQTLNEGHFVDNLKAGIRAGVSGYAARKTRNDSRSRNDKFRKQNILPPYDYQYENGIGGYYPENGKRNSFTDDEEISEAISEAGEVFNSLMDMWKLTRNGSDLAEYMRRIEGLFRFIKKRSNLNW